MNLSCFRYPFVVMLCSVLVFSACKKEASEERPKDVVDKELPAKVAAWLEGQKSSTQPGKAANIESLKGSLDFSGLRLEPYKDSEQFVIVPVKASFKVAHHLDDNMLVYLLVVRKNDGTLSKANLCLYTPFAGQRLSILPAGTFSRLYNDKAPEADGKYGMLSVTGRRLYEVEFKNHKRVSFGAIREKQGATTQGRRMAGCIDWYLVTTYYFADGTTSQTEVFVTRTCDGQGCSDPNMASVCPDDGSGSGGIKQRLNMSMLLINK